MLDCVSAELPQRTMPLGSGAFGLSLMVAVVPVVHVPEKTQVEPFVHRSASQGPPVHCAVRVAAPPTSMKQVAAR